MADPPSDALLTRFSALPAARPLLERLAAVDGVYLVGGAVRDLVLGGSPVDLDLVVDGELAPVAELLGTPFRSHDRFTTCTVVLNGFRYDLARARRETYPHPGALPVVQPAGIDEDLCRRDFTVNALALGLGGAQRGRLVQAPGALEDLRQRRLRVLHDASFIDDPTRLLRLARYAGRLGFAVDEHTLALARRAAAHGALDTVSGPRIGAELRLMGAEPDPVAEFHALAEIGADTAIAPGFGIDGAKALTVRRALALLPADGDRTNVVLAVASAGVDPDRLGPLLDRLAFTAGRREVIVAAVRGAPALADRLRAARTAAEIAAAVGDAPVEAVTLAGALGAEAPARQWLEHLRHVRLEIDGADLLAAGVKQGPEVGAALRRALAAKLDGRAQGREAELAAALGSAGPSEP